ncbi:MAG: pentapeptide repeat-containing protein, partial [Actinomycetes bacterium]
MSRSLRAFAFLLILGCLPWTQAAPAEGAVVSSAASYQTTSTTSNSISTGLKTFTVDAGLSWAASQNIAVVNTSANYMIGTVSSYGSTTLVVAITDVHGSTGPFNSWTVSPIVRGCILQIRTSCANTDLSKQDLSGLDLRFSILAPLNFSKTRFIETRLNGANLSRDSLVGADFTGADLTSATMSGANLDRANFTGALLRGVKGLGVAGTPKALPWPWMIVRGNLTGPGAYLESTNYAFQNVRGFRLGGADFRYASLSGANFTLADLNGANLHNAQLPGAKLRLADIGRADLTGANLRGADVSQVNSTST